jgi:aspartyl-tRNA(Asn)/glutamyl-tRNA(Gln) amidotransferase subunit A
LAFPGAFHTLRRDLAAGKTTCVTTTQEFLSKIEASRHLNAFLEVFPTEALERSAAIDAKLSAGTAGVLAGMVVAIKDNICVKDKRVTCGSRILAEYVSPYHAAVVERLIGADAIIIGKTNLDEFAMGSSTEHSAFGPVRNPVNDTRVPGGSSGGSAAAVAASLAMTALGSDTGGSIRQPASMCGVVGLKPTYGRVSRYGLVAFASSLDQIGPVGNSVDDVARMLQVIAGHDPRDSTSASVGVPDYVRSLGGDVRGLRIGIPKEYFPPVLDEEIREAIMAKVDLLRHHGAEIKEVSLPHSEYTIATYYILATAEASSNLARFDGARYGRRSNRAATLSEMYGNSRSEGFGDEVKRRIMLGTYVLSSGYYDAYYRKAQKVRRLIKEDFERSFLEVDCLIAPTSPTTAFRIGEKMDDPLQMYLSDVFTVSANLAGIPGMSFPCGNDRNGLPVGLQIFANAFREETIFRVASFLERV